MQKSYDLSALTAPDSNRQLRLVQILDKVAEEPVDEIYDQTFEHHLESEEEFRRIP